jgi:flagellar motor switch protein FliG
MMENATPTREAEPAALNKTQKVAVLLVMLGPESAAAILKHFPTREIEAISREMARSALISQVQQESILQDFSEVALTASTSVAAGPEVTRTTLEKALGTFKASDVLGRVTPVRAATGTMQVITEMDPRHIFNLLRDEQPQTIAFVTSYLPPDKAAQVLSLLRPEQRESVVERLATLAPTPVEVAEKVVEVLNAKLGLKQTRAMNQTGGVTNAAGILNAIDKTLSRNLLANLEERNPELSQAIRKKMFTFEDLLRIEPMALQRVMREVEMRDLTLALKKTSDSLRDRLLSCVSRRAAQGIKEEMGMLGQVRLREVEAAQFRIIDIVRKLEADGEIELQESETPEYEAV